MKNLWSYCGLVDAKIRASDKDLPVRNMKVYAMQPKFAMNALQLFPIQKDRIGLDSIRIGRKLLIQLALSLCIDFK